MNHGILFIFPKTQIYIHKFQFKFKLIIIKIFQNKLIYELSKNNVSPIM